MRRLLLKEMPLLTRFTFGALNPLTIGQYTLRELTEYRTQLDEYANAENKPTGVI